MKNLKILITILGPFIIALATSMLLELVVFQHWLRQIILILFILVQFAVGYKVLVYLVNRSN